MRSGAESGQFQFNYIPTDRLGVPLVSAEVSWSFFLVAPDVQEADDQECRPWRSRLRVAPKPCSIKTLGLDKEGLMSWDVVCKLGSECSWLGGK